MSRINRERFVILPLRKSIKKPTDWVGFFMDGSKGHYQPCYIRF